MKEQIPLSFWLAENLERNPHDQNLKFDEKELKEYLTNYSKSYIHEHKIIDEKKLRVLKKITKYTIDIGLKLLKEHEFVNVAILHENFFIIK